jgi:hypothetical protein
MITKSEKWQCENVEKYKQHKMRDRYNLCLPCFRCGAAILFSLLFASTLFIDSWPSLHRGSSGRSGSDAWMFLACV